MYAKLEHCFVASSSGVLPYRFQIPLKLVSPLILLRILCAVFGFPFPTLWYRNCLPAENQGDCIKDSFHLFPFSGIRVLYCLCSSVAIYILFSFLVIYSRTTNLLYLLFRGQKWKLFLFIYFIFKMYIFIPVVKCTCILNQLCLFAN
jgi:hypothetical protein